MIYFQGTTDFYMAGPSIVTLGKFDGVHQGHRKLMQEVLRQTKQIPGSSGVVFAFNAKNENLLLTEEEQVKVIEEIGMDCLIRCPFVPEISGMPPAEFVQKILKDKLHAVSVVVGTDFRFGHNRAGDADWLLAHAEEFDLDVSIMEKETWQSGREISSTFIREELTKGDMAMVNALSGRAWSVSGLIVHGAHLGTKLGMPTCNLIPPADKMLPPNGVYYSRSIIEEPDGRKQIYNSITNIGTKPTVDGSYRGVETYLYHAAGDLYGRQMTVQLLQYVRPERKFTSVNELRAQIASDIHSGESYFENRN